MDILMIANNQYLSDIRIKREAEELAAAGHNIHVVSGNADEGERHGSVNNVQITRVGTDSKLRWLIYSAIYVLSFYHPLWVVELYPILSKGRYDIIYYHDIHHAKTATRLGRYFNLFVVSDLHEMYPQSVNSWREELSLMQRLSPSVLLRPVWRYQRMERYAVTHSDVLVTVSPELLDYFLERYAPEQLSTVVVRNVPDLDRLDNMEIQPVGYDDDFVISYVGGMSPQRGLDTVVQAMPPILHEIPNAKLLIIGDGVPSYVNRIKSMVHELELGTHVEFVGWVDFEMVPSYFATSDVTLCPLTDNPDSRIALPNKIFQAMAFQTPLLASDLPAMSRIIRDADAGLLFRPGNQVDLVKQIQFAYSNPDEMDELAANGRGAVEREYNIEYEMRKLHEVLKRLNQDGS
jgi:glycosyltransferase involved in cell wall biosynthesis